MDDGKAYLYNTYVCTLYLCTIYILTTSHSGLKSEKSGTLGSHTVCTMWVNIRVFERKNSKNVESIMQPLVHTVSPYS